MNRYLSVIVLGSSLASASIACKSCHPLIYNEYIHSAHYNSYTQRDSLFKAVWSKAPNKKGCIKCHIAPPKKEIKATDSIACIGCHTIKEIKEAHISNSNIYEKRAKYFYSAQISEKGEILKYKNQKHHWSLFGSSVNGSPYHTIDYSNKIFYNAQVCMGCHSHKRNKHDLILCQTLDGKMTKDDNCIKCHMQNRVGSATTIRITKTHKSHYFSGSRFDTKSLSKYINLSYSKAKDGIDITIENKTPHPLLTHPMRLLVLKVSTIKDGKVVESKSVKFMKILGKDGKPTPPWLANSILKNSMIKAKEKRVIKFDIKKIDYDSIEATLGYYLINPKIAKKLGIDEKSKLLKFHILKKEYWNI